MFRDEFEDRLQITALITMVEPEWATKSSSQESWGSSPSTPLSGSKIIRKFHKILGVNSFITDPTFSRNIMVVWGREMSPETWNCSSKFWSSNLPVNSLGQSQLWKTPGAHTHRLTALPYLPPGSSVTVPPILGGWDGFPSWRLWASSLQLYRFALEFSPDLWSWNHSLGLPSDKYFEELKVPGNWSKAS